MEKTEAEWKKAECKYRGLNDILTPGGTVNKCINTTGAVYNAARDRRYMCEISPWPDPEISAIDSTQLQKV